MDLVRITDGGDGLSLDKVQAQQPHFLLSGILTADPGGGVLVLSLLFLGWIGFPAAAYLIRSNWTFRLRRNKTTRAVQACQRMALAL